MSVVTRFAPSPTGYLHIGGGRTALFNWLFARHHGGIFRLRIEDTDRERSIPSAIEAIFDGMRWLGLDWDDEVVMQFARAPRHAEAAMEMLNAGAAYLCYCTPDELEAMRAKAKAEGKPQRYDGTWRDRDPKDAPAGIKPVVRLKAPRDGEMTVQDRVQGPVTVHNSELDDLVLLRSDGTPTYMLSVVVDDHDMGITHVIRGDDHLTNTFRQVAIYKALGWQTPEFAHIPLIHGPDGAKLSKRHGALGIDAYRDMGYLPEAMRNYLLRLGWGHGDDEIISTAQAIEWFDLPAVGRAPSRLDFNKLAAVNAHYIKEADDARLVDLIIPGLEKAIGPVSPDGAALLVKAMPGLKPRAKTMIELAEMALLYLRPRPLTISDDARALISGDNRSIVVDLAALFREANDFTAGALEEKLRAYAEERGLKLGKVAQPLRAALTGGTVSPPIFEFASLIGRAETLARLQDAAG